VSYKKNNSIVIFIAVSVIALALVATSIFNHSYTAFAASKKGSSSSSSSNNNGVTTLGGSSTTSSSPSSSSAAATPNSNALTKKELSSFIDCIRTANGSQGLTHKVVTNCLDTAKGITSVTTGGGGASSATRRGGANAAGSSIGGSSATS
jgi:hypothetical protein